MEDVFDFFDSMIPEATASLELLLMDYPNLFLAALALVFVRGKAPA